MGVIQNGATSGVLPSSEAFAVHYPGYPSSTARAVKTLGGTEGILKARAQTPTPAGVPLNFLFPIDSLCSENRFC